MFLSHRMATMIAMTTLAMAVVLLAGAASWIFISAGYEEVDYFSSRELEVKFVPPPDFAGTPDQDQMYDWLQMVSKRRPTQEDIPVLIQYLDDKFVSMHHRCDCRSCQMNRTAVQLLGMIWVQSIPLLHRALDDQSKRSSALNVILCYGNPRAVVDAIKRIIELDDSRYVHFLSGIGGLPERSDWDTVRRWYIKHWNSLYWDRDEWPAPLRTHAAN